MAMFATLLLTAILSLALWKTTQVIGLHLLVGSVAVTVSYVLGLSFRSSLLGFVFATSIVLTELVICSRHILGQQNAA